MRAMATRSKVKVLGTTYYITTSGSEDRVRRIEEQMNEQLAAIQEQRPSLSTLDALVILSLNLMDEITDAENSTDRMREQLSQYLEDAAKALWKAGIYAETGMGCTGPLVMMSEANLAKAQEILKAAGYIG